MKGDRPGLASLIAESARTLGTADYRAEQIEGALRGAFGVDSQLLDDGTYFVIELDGRPVACGGWSRRRTLFGGDARPDRDASALDPATDAAKIRAFFVHPDFARRGLGSAILDHCEQDATSRGFARFELMATLPGVRFYSTRGYRAGPPVSWRLDQGLTITFVPMDKPAAAGTAEQAPSDEADLARNAQ
jgi:GNAT superfamily N-acetyltransferase